MHYPRVSLYALVLATAGIPLYIHLPRFAAVNLDIGLGTLGVLLLLIRCIDFVQDPLLGRLADRYLNAQPALAFSAAAGLALGFPLLFALQPAPGTLWQLAALLVLLYTSYSLGTILVYGRSEVLARDGHPQELLTLASWREAGQLAGVIIATVAPSLLVLAGAGERGYPTFGLVLAVVAIAGAWFSRPVWRRIPAPGTRLSLPRFSGSGALRLLSLALVNSLPVALTSTLFFFFVEDHLGLTGKAGLLLLVFFLAAGLGIPFWAFLSARIGNRQTLALAMAFAIATFVGAGLVAPQNAIGFLLVCMGSGFATGADILILPLMFSRALIHAGLNASSAFGIWSFTGKLALALAAATALPALETFGFIPGVPLQPSARWALVTAYAIVPCLLKLVALGFVLTLPSEEPQP